MRNFFGALVAGVVAISGSQGLAGGWGGSWGGGNAVSGAVAASGFLSGDQQGSWSVGAMNESYGFSSVRPSCSRCGTGVETSTSGGSVTEGFGSNFHGVSGAGGVGFGHADAGFGFRR